MGLATYHADGTTILYDAQRLCDAAAAPPLGPAFADPEMWRRMGRITGEAPGRGASLFLDAGDGREWVLRPYRRGGLIARLSARRYLWTGLERTRAFRELRLTAELHARGLPVPAPVAAAVTRHGLTYEAALITERLPGARTLAERLGAGQAGDTLLTEVGRTIRRFHDVGLDHVDLNARNLLVDEAQCIWLIDLDRCRLRRGDTWKTRNLGRLKRSLVKLGHAEAITPVFKGYQQTR